MELHTLGVDGGYTQKDVAGGRAGVHRLDDCDTRGRAAASASSRGCTTTARRSCSATHQGRRRQRATASRCSTSSRRIPSTARFIATKLARRFVADEPPPALVDRAAARVPRDRRRHPRGGPHDRDARRSSSRRAAYRAKVKTPFEFVGERGARERRRRGRTRSRSSSAMRELGMPLYQLPAADRLRGPRRRVGQHRRAAQPHELRGRADAAADVDGASRRGRRGPPATVDAGTRGYRRDVLADDLADATRDHGRARRRSGAGDRLAARLAGIPEKVETP